MSTQISQTNVFCSFNSDNLFTVTVSALSVDLNAAKADNPFTLFCNVINIFHSNVQFVQVNL